MVLWGHKTFAPICRACRLRLVKGIRGVQVTLKSINRRRKNHFAWFKEGCTLVETTSSDPHISCSLNSSKGGYIEHYIGEEL